MALEARALLEPLFQGQPPQDDRAIGVTTKVVLCDHNGWWAPLTHLFYSNSCRCLVSAHPESSIEEIESYYCPRCLKYFSEVEASLSGHRCPSCFECPDCHCTLLITRVADKDPPSYQFECGYCHWQSTIVGLVEEDPEFLGMTASVAERDSPEEDKFRQLLMKLRRRAVDNARAMALRSGKPLRISPAAFARALSPLDSTIAVSLHAEDDVDSSSLAQPSVAPKVWRLTDLYDKETKAVVEAEEQRDFKRSAELYGRHCSHDVLSAEHEEVPEDFLALESVEGTSRADQRLGLCLQQPTRAKDLRPLRKPLFTKRSRRCRKDVEEGRPGILLKPKVNPLEGDSSMRSNVGRWFQKDSSAVHVIPSVTVVDTASFETFLSAVDGHGTSAPLSLLIKLVNPLHGTVRATIVPEGHVEQGADNVAYYRKHLKRVLGERHVLCVADLPTEQQDEHTTTVTLDTYEDEYLDDEDAEEAPDDALIAAKLSAEGSGKVKIYQQKFTAWLRVPVRCELSDQQLQSTLGEWRRADEQTIRRRHRRPKAGL